MKPSPFQEEIYRWQETGTGDAFVSAVAGSGKTTTLVELAKRLPPEMSGRAVFVAFNKHIAEELSRQLPQGVRAATIHSLGMQAMRKHLSAGSGWKVEGSKYSRLASFWLTSEMRMSRSDKRFNDAQSALSDLVRFTMLTLTNPSDLSALRRLAEKYNIEKGEIDERMLRAVGTILQWGIDGLPRPEPRTGLTYAMRETISFDDMVYLPVRLGVSVEQFGMIYCDEAQDLNSAQTEFVLRMRAPGGRAVFVGDPKQAIYGFAGANSDSVERIIERTGATSLPLNVCYRCPVSHLKLAQELVPKIEPAPNAALGKTGQVPCDQLSSELKTGDLVLCRTTAPLVTLVFDLLSHGVPAKVRGRDIGSSISKLVDVVTQMDGYRWSDFSVCLSDYCISQVTVLSRREGTEMQIESLQDRVDSLQAIYRNAIARNVVSDAASLKSYIAGLFDDTKAPVMLSTIHKAKGLQADRVFILRYDLMPHAMASTQEAIAQEYNLKYIALTRAKKELWFIQGEPSIKATESPGPKIEIVSSAQPAFEMPAGASQEFIAAFREMMLQAETAAARGVVAPAFCKMLAEESREVSIQQLQARRDSLREILYQRKSA